MIIIQQIEISNDNQFFPKVYLKTSCALTRQCVEFVAIALYDKIIFIKIFAVQKNNEYLTIL